jgi:uncharacterized protein YdaU (DUF1376 family)
MNYFRFWIGDYLKDTADLSLAEHGAYALLLAEYYNRRGPLDPDVRKLQRVCRAGCDAEHEAVATVAERFFPVGEDGLRHNKRADAELRVALAAIEAQRVAARLTNESRYGARSSARSSERSTDRSSTPSTIHQPSSTIHHPPPEEAEAPARSRGSRLPPDWQPSEILRAWAEKERPDLNIAATVENFRDHWHAVPGSRGLKLDWEKTFRKWVRGERSGPVQRGASVDLGGLALKLAAEERTNAKP